MKTALVYPGTPNIVKGIYKKLDNEENKYECSIITLDVMDNIGQWQENIASKIENWINN